MKYKQAKEILDKNGFELKYFSTGANCEDFIFEHPKISGDIILEFSDNELFEEDEVALDDPRFSEVDIQSIAIRIDIGISFLTDGIIDTYGAEEINQIVLYKQDIDLFEKVMDMIQNPLHLLDFQVEYTQKVLEFNTFVKKFLPVLDKYNTHLVIEAVSGNENTIFRDFVIQFRIDNHIRHHKVAFYFKCLNWKKEIMIDIEGGTLPESAFMDENVSLKDFEKEVERQFVIYNKFFK